PLSGVARSHPGTTGPAAAPAAGPCCAGNSLEPHRMALRYRAMERLHRMSSNGTNRMNLGGLRGGGRALLVLGAAGLMLGAHYTRPTPPAAGSIHAGAASAATREGWSRA